MVGNSQVLNRPTTTQASQRSASSNPRNAHTISSEHFYVPEVYEAETRVIHHRVWNYFGHRSRVASAGQYLTGVIAGEPVVAMCGSDGHVRAYSNVCRHRAGPLVDGEGRRNSLVCRYHGWRYDLEGKLRHAPEFENAEGFDPSSICLPRFRAELWGDLLFVCLDRSAPSLSDYLGDIMTHIPERRLGGLEYERRVTLKTDCNWKTLLFNGNECYHCGIVHKSSLALSQNAKTHVIEHHGPHWQLARSEMKEDTSEFRRDSEPYTNFAQTHEVIPTAPDISEVESRNVYVAQVFPTCWITLSPNHLVVQRVSPVGPEKTEWIRDYLFSPSDHPDAGEAKDAVVRIRELQAQEDVDICQISQRNLRSVHYDQGRLSPDAEMGVIRFQENYLNYMA